MAGFQVQHTLFAPPADAGIFNIVSYGADPTGVGDSTAAFRAAIAAALPGNTYGDRPIVYVPPGIFRITDTIKTVNAQGVWAIGLCLVGAGDSSIIRLSDNAPGFGNPAAPKPMFMTGDETGGTSANGLGSSSGNRAFNHSFTDIYFDIRPGNTGAIAIDWLTSNHGSITNCTFRDWGYVSSNPAQSSKAAIVANRGGFGSGTVYGCSFLGFQRAISCEQQSGDFLMTIAKSEFINQSGAESVYTNNLTLVIADCLIKSQSSLVKVEGINTTVNVTYCQAAAWNGQNASVAAPLIVSNSNGRVTIDSIVNYRLGASSTQFARAIIFRDNARNITFDAASNDNSAPSINPPLSLLYYATNRVKGDRDDNVFARAYSNGNPPAQHSSAYTPANTIARSPNWAQSPTPGATLLLKLTNYQPVNGDWSYAFEAAVNAANNPAINPNNLPTRIYLPRGSYNWGRTVLIKGNVVEVVGFGGFIGRASGFTGAYLAVDGTCGNRPLEIRNLWAPGGQSFYSNGRRNLRFQSCKFDTVTVLGTPTTTQLPSENLVTIVDCIGYFDLARCGGEAFGLNSEYVPTLLRLSDGAKFRVCGFKTENDNRTQGSVLCEVGSKCAIELYGYQYALVPDFNRPLFKLNDVYHARVSMTTGGGKVEPPGVVNEPFGAVTSLQALNVPQVGRWGVTWVD